MLENYFIQNNSGVLLKNKTCDSVSSATSRTIINCAVDFMISAFGLENITMARKKMTASALIILFPVFRYKESKTDGTVSGSLSFRFSDLVEKNHHNFIFYGMNSRICLLVMAVFFAIALNIY